MKRRLRRIPSRDEVLQYVYDYGVDIAEEMLGISDALLWRIIDPPVPRIEFPTYRIATRDCCTELADIACTSYPAIKRRLLLGVYDVPSAEDCLHDAFYIAIRDMEAAGIYDREYLEESVSILYKRLSELTVVNERKFTRLNEEE